MSNLINWLEFGEMIPFMGIGMLIHILLKFIAAKITGAKKRKDFEFRIFWDRNKWAWLAGVVLNIVGCYVYVRGIDLGIDAPWDVVAIILGISGGSIAKAVLKVVF